jgi:hypothetical protein
VLVFEPDTDVEAVEVKREEEQVRILYRTKNALKAKAKAKALPPPLPFLDNQYWSDDEAQVEEFVSEFTPLTSQGGSMATSEVKSVSFKASALESEGGQAASIVLFSGRFQPNSPTLPQNQPQIIKF